jgi:hypothetical protein
MPDHCHRKFTRFPVNTLVWWNQDWEAEPVALLNISAGGMLCEFPESFDVDEKISLEVELPRYEAMVLCRCRVVHSRPREGHYLVGLEIIDMEGMSKGELVHNLENYLGGAASLNGGNGQTSRELGSAG